MGTELFNNFTMHRLPHGVLFHPATTFNPAKKKPVVTIITNLELFPALHGFRVVVLQLAEFLKSAGYCTVLINQAKTDNHYITSHQAICDRYFDATCHIAQQTQQKGAIKGDCTAEETLWCLRWIEQRFGIYAAIAEYAYMTPCLSALSHHTLKMAQTIDVVSRLSVEELRLNAIDFKRGMTRDEEVKLLNHADVLIAITEVERRILKDMLPDKNVITVGYAVPPSNLQVSAETCRDMVFLASSNPFNRDGIVTFIKDVLPKIRLSVPDSRLLLAGQICSRLKSDGYPETLTAPGVVPMGPVDDVERLYESSAIVINPTRFGTGLKIKTVEAIAAGKAVVTTSTGCEGLPQFKDSPFIIADDADSFASACSELLLNSARRHSLEKSAVTYTEQCFSMNQVYRELNDTFHSLRKHKPPSPPYFTKAVLRNNGATEILKNAFLNTEVHLLEIGYPTHGIIPDLASSIRITKHDSLPPISSLDELDYQWMKTGDKMNNIKHAVRFHRMPPERFLANHLPFPDCNLLYLHGEYRHEQLFSNLCAFAPSVRENGLITIDGYGNINTPGITQAVDNFIFLELSNISNITCASSGATNSWPLLRENGDHTLVITLKSRCNSYCIATRSPHPPAPEPISLTPNSLRLIVRERMAALRSSGITRMAVFGAGAHTIWLEKICRGLDLEIIAVLDDNPAGKPPLFGLTPIKSELFNPATVDAILLSSDCLQQEMTLRCRKIYGKEIKLENLYNDLPPGPYQK